MGSTSNTDEATLSLLESGRESNFSTAAYLLEREQIERLKCRVRVLESENMELKRLQPRLHDAKGKDCTAEIAKLVKELGLATDNCAKWEEEHRALAKKYGNLEQSAFAQINQRDKELHEIKTKALELEEENEKLREQIQDEQSRIHHLEAAHVNQSLEELHLRDQIHGTFTKMQAATPSEQIGAQLGDSFGDLDITDANQIATHMFMILERLDKNSRKTEELQTAVFAFLAENGFNADPEKFAVYSKILKEAMKKRQEEIRAANDQLLLSGSKLQNTSAGDKELEVCMRHIYQDSVSMSTTFPSFAGIAATQQMLEASMPEGAADLMHNATVESVAAMNTLAGRTSNLAEACIRMFEKLRSTAEFFQTLLKTIGVSEEELGADLLRKIESMKLDLDKSMGEARGIVDEAKNAEQNLRTILFEQSQSVVVAVNSSAVLHNSGEHSKLQQELAAAATAHSISQPLITAEESAVLQEQPQAPLPPTECAKCQELERQREAMESELEEVRAQKEEVNTALAKEAETCAELKEQLDQMESKIQELESKMCEKCLELQELYNSAQSALDTEISEKRELAGKIAELALTNTRLIEEKEQLSSSVKENDPIQKQRAQLVEGIRGEMHKIYDTMSFASKATGGTGLKLKKKNSGSSNKGGGTGASQSQAAASSAGNQVNKPQQQQKEKK